MNLALFLAGWTVVSLLLVSAYSALAIRWKRRARTLDERQVQQQLRGERKVFPIARAR